MKISAIDYKMSILYIFKKLKGFIKNFRCPTFPEEPDSTSRPC